MRYCVICGTKIKIQFFDDPYCPTEKGGCGIKYQGNNPGVDSPEKSIMSKLAEVSEVLIKNL
jgi:hypothetical protein